MFNKLIVALMPLAPRFIVKMVSKRYIAGEESAAAIAVCRELQARGYLTTLDILGESVTTVEQANAGRDHYLTLIDDVVNSGIEKNISLKPTALGLSISPELARTNITTILEKAARADIFIRIDMEDSPYTSQTIALYEELRQTFPLLGTVIQAYMRRSLKDVQHLAAADGNLRICKGIYKEAPEIAYQDPEEIRQNYLLLIKEMLTKRAYVGIATHDIRLIDQTLGMIEELGNTPDQYEFQALLGVPISRRLDTLLAAGHRVRIYVPFGSEWYAYSSRRLKENPDIAGYVLKNLWKA